MQKTNKSYYSTLQLFAMKLKNTTKRFCVQKFRNSVPFFITFYCNKKKNNNKKMLQLFLQQTENGHQIFIPNILL